MSLSLLLLLLKLVIPDTSNSSSILPLLIIACDIINPTVTITMRNDKYYSNSTNSSVSYFVLLNIFIVFLCSGDDKCDGIGNRCDCVNYVTSYFVHFEHE